MGGGHFSRLRQRLLLSQRSETVRGRDEGMRGERGVFVYRTVAFPLFHQCDSE